MWSVGDNGMSCISLGGTKTPVASPVPADYGFDHSATFNSNAEWLDPGAPPLDPTCPSPRMPPATPSGNTTSSPFCNNPYWAGDSSTWTVNHSLGFIANATTTKTPFYLNAWFHVSHAALVPRPEQLAVYPEAATCRLCAGPQCIPGAAPMQKSCPSQIFMASQTDADTQIGRLIAALEQHHVSESTIVALSTDNGPEERAIFTNGAGNTGPFRGQKRSLYEGGIRLPFIVRLPGSIVGGRVDHSVVGAVDWLPTIASLTGLVDVIPPVTKATLRGIDLSPILLEKTAAGAAAAEAAPDLRNNNSYTPRPASHPLLNEWRFGVSGPCVNGAPRLAIRDNDLKLLINPPPNATMARGATPDSERVELYHLPPITDPSLLASPPEYQNLAHDPAYAEHVQRLSEPLLAWYKTLPDGPHSVARGCAAYKFPGMPRPPPDEQSQGEGAAGDRQPWEESDEAAWWG